MAAGGSGSGKPRHERLEHRAREFTRRLAEKCDEDEDEHPRTASARVVEPKDPRDLRSGDALSHLDPCRRRRDRSTMTAKPIASS